ncbi:hypothetical protein IWQ60_009769 [Tieghemiomyces parasiticus]|uniref:Uncharacterized protein n=1 Tax=Tieghemiomyces parasiticus TaxID=78921 RepID=A0A9W7ZSW8_9FUNG|nr:hypothetical protein IWQ60_009769 [Tieghemiomyces parasiticus]
MAVAARTISLGLADVLLIRQIPPPPGLAALFTDPASADPAAPSASPSEWFLGRVVELGTRDAVGTGCSATGHRRWTLVGLPAERPPTLHACCQPKATAGPADRCHHVVSANPFYDILLAPEDDSTTIYWVRNVYRRPSGDLLELDSHAEDGAQLLADRRTLRSDPVGACLPDILGPSVRPLHRFRFITTQLRGDDDSAVLPNRHRRLAQTLATVTPHADRPPDYRRLLLPLVDSEPARRPTTDLCVCTGKCYWQVNLPEANTLEFLGRD